MKGLTISKNKLRLVEMVGRQEAIKINDKCGGLRFVILTNVPHNPFRVC